MCDLQSISIKSETRFDESVPFNLIYETYTLKSRNFNSRLFGHKFQYINRGHILHGKFGEFLYNEFSMEDDMWFPILKIDDQLVAIKNRKQWTFTVMKRGRSYVKHQPISYREGISRQVSKELRQFIYSRDGFKCLKCNTKNNLSVDHIVPFSKGGRTLIYNLQTLCISCNSNKSDKNQISYLNTIILGAGRTLEEDHHILSSRIFDIVLKPESKKFIDISLMQSIKFYKKINLGIFKYFS